MQDSFLSVPRLKFLETPGQKGSCALLTAAISAVHQGIRHAPKPGLVTTNPDEGLESSPTQPNDKLLFSFHHRSDIDSQLHST